MDNNNFQVGEPVVSTIVDMLTGEIQEIRQITKIVKRRGKSVYLTNHAGSLAYNAQTGHAISNQYKGFRLMPLTKELMELAVDTGAEIDL